MKCLITGGGGFIGSHLTDKLSKRGHEIVIVGLQNKNEKRKYNSFVKFHGLDIGDPKIFRIIKKSKPEIIFHLAGPIHLREGVDSPNFDCSIGFFDNLKKILDCSLRVNVKKIIFASSGAVYTGNDAVPFVESNRNCPSSLYGLANLMLEKLLEEYYKVCGLDYIAFRFSNVYGPRQWKKGIIPSMIISILDKKPPIINGKGTQTRDFVYIDDVVNAFLIALNTKKKGVFNISSGTEISINGLFDQIAKILNSKIKPKHYADKNVGIEKNFLDFSKAKKELGYQPDIELANGLERTINWFKTNSV